MKKIMLYALLLAFAFGAISKLDAQITVAIGEGNSTNLSTQSPSPYGSYDKSFRQQYLYRASEIQDAGGGSGNINSLAFKVEGLYTCPAMTNFRLRLKHTDQTELSQDFEEGSYQEVFFRNYYIPVPGWNVHTFNTPFLWNGSQNILVEVVTDLTPENYPHNASVHYTASTYHSALRFGDDLIPAIQASSGTLSRNRANIRFNMAEFPLIAPPYSAQVISPADGATLLRPTTALAWISGGGATAGYKLNFGTNNPPSNIEYMLDLADATSYAPLSGLAFDTTYYWQIVPYNSVGNSANCPIWSFSTHDDTTIYELPYSQNWDAVTVPELPFGWTALASATSAWATVETTDSFSYSPPNCVRIFKGTNTFDQLLLVSPKISPLISMNSIRIKARIKNAYSLQVGVMSNPADLSSFEPVQTIFISGSGFAEYDIPLRTYTGAGRHIAFRHSGDNPNRRFYIDDLILEEIAEHDLAATAIRGQITPSVQASTNFSVDILNYGAAAQNNYTVKLIDSEGLELGSAAGPAISAGETVTVNIPWTPAQEGEMNVYGKVVLASDSNTLNDETSPLSVSVRPEGTYSVTIGDGDETHLVPWRFNDDYSLFQCLYLQDEIGISGNITGISFYNNFINAVLDTPIKIWLGTTLAGNLSQGLVDPHRLTLVYDGNMDFPSGENTITIPLQVPYAYAAYNLVLYANRPLDTNSYSSSNRFKAQTVGTNRARHSVIWDIYSDPMAPYGHGTLSGTFPKITFIMESLGDEATFVVTPRSHDFGPVSISETVHQDIFISNGGGEALVINNISISGNSAFTLTGIPTLPASINTGGSLAFGLNYSPGSVGLHSAQILLSDNLGRELHRINVYGTGYDATIYSLPITQNWDTATVPDLPRGWSSINNSYTAYTFVNTSTESPYSAPNCVRMWYSHNYYAQLCLISPLIDDAIDITKIRVRAMMKDWGALRMQVGTIVDPTDLHSFELAGTFTIVGDWTYGTWSEYFVSLTHHTGVGRYLAIRPDPTVSGFSAFMDDLSFEEIVPNDLAAVSLRGSTTLSLGLASDYTVRILNNGYAAQSNYQVQLVNAQGNILATASAGDIAAGETIDLILSYTPTAAGYREIMGKVVLPGDSNSANNRTAPLGILIQPVNIFSVTLGDGDEYQQAPWDFYHKNSLFQALYYRSEIGNFGKIVGISFYNSFEAEISATPIQLWLGYSYLSDLSAGWIDPTTLTKVYDGMMHFPAGQNTITIPLSTPYNYVAGNLVLYAHRPMDTRYYRPEYHFEAQTVSTNCARKISRDYSAFNPMQPPIYETELSGSFPKTTFLMTTNDMGSLTGTITASGSPLPNVELNIDDAGLQTTTSAFGEYSFPFLLQGDYTLFAQKAGYEDQSVDFTIVERQNTPLDLLMIASIPVSVNGTILGSDSPTAGLAEVTVSIHGIVDYTANTNATGQFVVENIPSGNSYDYTISRAGYQSETGTITVGSVDLDMGSITLLENAYVPRNVVAEMNDSYTAVLLQWELPSAEVFSRVSRALRANNIERADKPGSLEGRALAGYEIYRIVSGQEDNEASWSLLAAVPLNTFAYEDQDWFTTIGGICRWGVKAIYTGEVSSPAALSNLLVGPSTGKIVGFVYDEEGQGISGATVTNYYSEATTGPTGAYALELLMGVYSVTAWADGYWQVRVDNVEVFPLHETSLNFTLGIEWVANQNEVNLVTATALKGNNPNPFNPATTIHYDILEPCKVRLDVYNIKGQKVRSLLNEAKSSGRHSIVFEARDEQGRALSSGVYFYRFTAGKYSATRKMLLME